MKKVLESSKKDLLNLGIGDVSLPLIPEACKTLQKAAFEMSERPIGYPSSHGDHSLRQTIFEKFYKNFPLSSSNIFISDGINSDLGNIQELFDQTTTFGVHEPSYPVPHDVCIMAGRSQFTTVISCDEKDRFLPKPPNHKIDVMYLCTPNNPSGTAMNYEELKAWVDWANFNKSILIVDAAYIDFIQDPSIPKSIYEIPGALSCAIELRSFSKSCGFTGLRCSFSVFPDDVKGLIAKQSQPLKAIWAKRMATKSNGIAYPIQQAALSCLSEQGWHQAMMQVNHYLKMAKALKTSCEKAGFETLGASNAPYVFIKCPQHMNSWQFFDYLLENLSIVSVPGSGFGKSAEGYIRLSGLITEEVCKKLVRDWKVSAVLSKTSQTPTFGKAP